MGAALKLINQKVFSKIELTSPGKLYVSLLTKFPISVIKSDKAAREANLVLSSLIELTNQNVFQKSELEQINLYIQGLAKAVQEYEKTRYTQSKTTGGEMLAHLMSIHGLKQTDLSKELGGQSIVSSILQGKRELNKKQILALSKRFNVSVETFFDRS